MATGECPMRTSFGLSTDFNSYHCSNARGVLLSCLGHCNLLTEFSVLIKMYGNGLWHRERIRNSLIPSNEELFERVILTFTVPM